MKSSDLSKLYFFYPFSAAELTQLMAKTKIQTHPAGEVIFHQDDASSSCFFLEFGAVRLGKKGRRHQTDSMVLGPGSLFGELAFLDHGPRHLEAVALEAVSIVEIPFAAIEECLAHSPGLGEKLYRAVALFLRERLSHLPEDPGESIARYQ